MSDNVNNPRERRSKSRAIKDLLSGARASMSEALYDRWNWTEEERRLIAPYVKRTKPSNAPTSSKTYTKADAFAAIAKGTENATTESVYRSRMNALLRMFDANEDVGSIFEASEDATIIGRIRERYKDPTTYIQLVLWLGTHDQRFAAMLTEERLRRYREAYAEERNLGVERALDAQSRRSVDDHVAIYESTKATVERLGRERAGSMDHLIATMYTHALYDRSGTIHMNPRNYFWNVELVKSDSEMDDEGNFLNTSSGRMLLNKYKTSGVYKPYDVALSPTVMAVLRSSLAETGARKYLLTKDNGERYQPSSLSYKVKQVMGHKIDDMRHAIETYEIHRRRTSRSHMAFVSRHSVATQDLVYVPR